MKVLFVSPSSERGGIYVYSQELLQNLKKDKVHTIDSKNYDSVTFDKVDKYGVVHMQHHYSYFGKPLPYINKFKAIVDKINKPLIVTVHDIILETPPGTMPFVKPVLDLAIKLLNKQTFSNNNINKFVVHTEVQKGILVQMGVDVSKIIVLPMGVPTFKEKFTEKQKKNTRKRWKIEDKKVLSILGFIFRRKGYETAIKALKSLDNNVVLMIAGDTSPKARVDKDYKQELVTFIKESNLEDRVIITGYLNEKEFNEIIGITDIMLAPFNETFGSPYSLATAIGYEKPIIASDIDSVMEIQKRMKCMEIFDKGDYKQLSKKINSLLKNETKKNVLIKAAKDYTLKYGFKSLAKQHYKIYREVLEQS